jgi:hypothetical protein
MVVKTQQMTYNYVDGNRMQVPDAVKSDHFFYLAKAPVLDPQDVKLVVDATTKFVHTNGLNAGGIDVMSQTRVESYGGALALAAMQRMLHQMGVSEDDYGDTSILVCLWAPPHVDESFEGSAFASLVLHTGPEPYVMQTFYTGICNEFGSPTVTASTRVLTQGSLVVFDPCTPHMTTPAYPLDAQMLVMLQTEVKDKTPEDRLNVLLQFPPLDTDKDHREVFNGYPP